MAGTPAEAVTQGLEQARLVAAMYADAEEALLARVAARVAEGLDDDDTSLWEAKRLGEIGQLRKDAERIINRLQAAAKVAAQRAVLEAWAAGMDSAVVGAVVGVHDERVRKRLERTLRDARKLGSKALINPGQGVAELAAQTVRMITSVQVAALRATEDDYRRVIAETAGRALVGAETRRDAAQRALNRFAAQGITGFKTRETPDREPRTWGMPQYVEMAMRTAMARAATDGHMATLRDAGMDLVIVSRLPYTCSTCGRWEGKILSQSGRAGVRMEPSEVDDSMVEVDVAGTVQEARVAGLLHPNCGHSLSVYLPGVTRPREVQERAASYGDSQQQRYLERQVRDHKRRAAVALDAEARRKAEGKIAGYQQRLREHTKATGLRRTPARERIDASPRNLEQLPDGEINRLKERFAGDGQITARLTQETQRRTDEREAERKAAGPAAADDPIEFLAQVDDLGDLTEDHLTALMLRYQDDEDGMVRMLAELDRIEAATKERQQWSWNWKDEETPEDRRISDLIATGRYSYMEAYAEVHGLDPAELERQERRALVQAEAWPGEDVDQTVRRMYAQWLDQQYDAAEAATRGVFLNKKGQASGVNDKSLFSGPTARARAYASEELKRWWQDNPRLTLTEFRALWLNRDADKKAAANIRAGSPGREFGL
ncbi:phage minor capsid protein [Streptosporangium sp. NPDC001681]|uniref:phage minor capsid protein n=1 Tax=Streptosporangium sp. NPDC001681 TaxID=3154395 RepID=UPI0033304433